MERLRVPLLLVAVAIAALIVALELGMAADLFATGGAPPPVSEAVRALGGSDELATPPPAVPVVDAGGLPGLAIAHLALLDGLVLFSLILIGLGLVVPPAILGRIQGAVSLVVAIVAALASVALGAAALQLVTLMVVLLSAVPFGTIAYLVRWGSFDVDAAVVALGVILTLKLVAAVCLLLAHQRIVANTGLVLLILTSLAATVVVSALHGFVPGFLVSISDAVAAIVIAIAAFVWAIAFVIGGLVGLARALAPGSTSAGD